MGEQYTIMLLQNFIDELDARATSQAGIELKPCCYCEAPTPVMDLNTKGVCERCEMDGA